MEYQKICKNRSVTSNLKFVNLQLLLVGELSYNYRAQVS